MRRGKNYISLTKYTSKLEKKKKNRRVSSAMKQNVHNDQLVYNITNNKNYYQTKKITRDNRKRGKNNKQRCKSLKKKKKKRAFK